MKKRSMFLGCAAVLIAVAFLAACGTAGAVRGAAAVNNLVLNPGFETDNMGVWRITLDGTANPPNAYEGEGAGRSMGPDHANPRPGGSWGFRFWRPEGPIGFTIEQDITVEEAGNYRFEVFITGGNAGTNAAIYTYALVNGEEVGRTRATTLPGWRNWNTPFINVEANEGDTVTIGASLTFPDNNAGGAWGTLDDFSFHRVSQ